MNQRPTVADDSWTRLAMAVSRREVPGMSILRERGQDVLIARTQSADGEPVIVKCWNRRGWRGAARRISRTNIGWREYQALRHLHDAGIPCPFPYAYRVLPPQPGVRHTEALISADLGVCRDSTEWFKALLRENPDAALAFEDRIIEATAAMVANGLLDTDHRLPNFVVPPDGVPVRIDFELCIPVRAVAWHPRLLGGMIGTLLGSHVFAVQPMTGRSVDFCRRLLARVPVPARSRRHARMVVATMLERQRRESGIDTPMPFSAEHL